MNKEDKKIAVVKGDDPYRQICDALELLGGKDKFFQKGNRILLKVNVTGPAPEGAGITTNISFVKALVRIICEAGALPVIADGTASAMIGTRKVFSLSGYDAIQEQYPVEFLDLNRDTMRTVKVPNPMQLESIQVANSIYEGFDLIVDLPVLKTHVMTSVSLSIKNLKGVIPPSEKRRFHDLGLHKCIADLASVVQPHLILADGTIGCEGLGPKEGTPVNLGIVVAGTHLVTVDAACCYIMGFDPAKIDHIAYSHQKIGGAIALDQIVWLGNQLQSVRYPFKPACPAIPEDGKINFISGSPCSGCIGAATIAAGRLVESGVLDKLNEQGIFPTFVIGSKFPDDQVWPDKDDLFFLGNCAKKASEGRGNYFPGCAPASIHITEFLAQYYHFSHESLEDGTERNIGKSSEHP